MAEEQPMNFDEKAVLLERCSQQAEQDILRGIEVQAVHRKGAYDPQITDRYNGTFEAWGYNVVIEAVFIEQVIILMRLWDNRGDVLSIPRAKSILDDKDFLERFIERERREPHSFEPDEREEILRRHLKRFNEAYATAKGHHSLGRLRDIRNEMLAHNAEEPAGQGAKYGYADDLLEKTIPIAESLDIIARSNEFHGKDFIKAWNKRADDFWSAAIHGVPEE